MSVVGIDLGTTNTVVGCVRTGKVHVLADEKGGRLLPSVVSFHPNGEVLVGAAAKARRVIDPKNTIYSHKRLIGRSWGSPEIAQARQRFAFELKEGPGQGPLVHARGQDYTLPEISAFVLKRTRQIAEAALGTPVERAVITVPAHFNELQRASTKVAGRVSGLEVLRILNEPTAAALAYGLGRAGNERVAVYDFGGGTFDCTLLDLNGNVFEVLATAGDSFLGGDDVDNLIADRMAEVYLKQERQDARQDPQMYERLKTTAEEVKIALSTAETHTVVLKEFGYGARGSSVNFVFTLSRNDFEAMITPLVERSFKVTQDALALARLSPTSFDKVILVGGSTRIPLVRKRVEAFFGAPPMDRVNPDEVVAIGAAIQAAALTEGVRRRSIPAPPGRGSQSDAQEFTQTSEVNPAALKPAFASAPPGFGFASGGGAQAADKFAFASNPGSALGKPGVPGARPAPGTGPSPRRATSPGVAPTRGAGAQPPAQAADATQANVGDPSLASFPDLSAPTPFEWFPSGGPSSSERTSDGDTKATKISGSPDGSRRGPMPAAAPPAAREDDGPGFGAIDEPPSLFSTPSASLPSFPSLSASGMPSPLGDDAPWRQEEQQPAPPPPRPGSQPSFSEGHFGAVADLSLISSTGNSSPRASTPDGGFGHVSDLSLISAQTAGAAMDAITNARNQALRSGQFEEETEAGQKKGEGPKEKHDRDPLLDRSDLPAVAAKPKPARKPGQIGMSKDGTASMMGKAPPPVAPQPFGPMEKIDDPHAHTAAMPQRPTATKPAATAPSPRDRTPPLNQTASLEPAKPARAPTSKRSTGTQAFGSAQSAPPPAQPSFTSPAGTPLSAPPPRHGASLQPPASPAFQAGPPPAPQRPPQGSFHPPPQAAFQPPPQAPFQPPPQAPFQPPPQAPFQPPPQAAFQPPPQAPFQPPPQAAFQPPPQAAFQPPPQAPFQPPPQAPFQPPPQAPFQPPPQAPFQPPPQAGPHPSQASVPPLQPSLSAAPPPQQPFAFGSAPPGAPNASQPPPIFGSFSAPPPADASHPLDYASGAFDPSIPGSPAAPQGMGFQAPVLVDVTPRGLVVETAGGYTDTIIPRNSKIPCERTRRFATGRDMQTTVRVRVAQGESTMFPQNTYLGEVELSGLRPAARGEVTVAVTFEVDADGTLRIRARDVQTGQEARATLQLIGVADESSVVMMINRFAQQPVVGGSTQ